MIRAPVSGKVNPMLIHRHAIAITAGLALAAAMCSGAPAATNRAPPSGLGIKRAQPPLPDVPIARYLGENLPRYRKAVDRARAWLDAGEIENALKTLTPREQNAVRLFFLHDRKYREIAALTGMPQNSIGPTLARALVKLRKIIENV